MMTAKDRCPWRTSSAARLPCSRDGVGYGRIHILFRQFELFTVVEDRQFARLFPCRCFACGLVEVSSIAMER
jgi:hypothetical protein